MNRGTGQRTHKVSNTHQIITVKSVVFVLAVFLILAAYTVYDTNFCYFDSKLPILKDVFFWQKNDRFRILGAQTPPCEGTSTNPVQPQVLGLSELQNVNFIKLENAGWLGNDPNGARIIFGNKDSMSFTDGLIGVNTDSPAYSLDISGSLRVSDTFVLSNLSDSQTTQKMLALNANSEVVAVDMSDLVDLFTQAQLTDLRASGDVTGLFSELKINPDTVGSNQLSKTSVLPGTYGSANASPRITVDEDGRVTAITLIDIDKSSKQAAIDVSQLGLGDLAYKNIVDMQLLFLQPTNNLADLDNVSVARSNLDLGDLAVKNQTDLAAVYASKSANLADLSDIAAARTNLGLGGLAIQNLSFLQTLFLSKSNNLSDISSFTDARSNLGLGDLATVNRSTLDTVYLSKATNLSDLSNVTTARTNLGLGDLAISNISDLNSTFLRKDGNLSEVPSPSIARSNLGLGNLAIKNSNELDALYASRSANLADLSSVAAARMNLGLGGLATLDLSYLMPQFLSTSNNLSDLSNLTTARANLGLGDLATTNQSALDSLYLTKAGNLTGINNVATARSNLGLGDLATMSQTTLDSIYLTGSANLIGLGNLSAARANLGLGDLAIKSQASLDALYASQSANLADLTSVSTARSNLGLGSLATLSFVDISDKTNLGVTAPLTLSGDTVGFDVNTTALTKYLPLTGGSISGLPYVQVLKVAALNPATASTVTRPSPVFTFQGQRWDGATSQDVYMNMYLNVWGSSAGQSELAVTNSVGDLVTIIANNGDYTFLSPSASNAIQTRSSPVMRLQGANWDSASGTSKRKFFQFMTNVWGTGDTNYNYSLSNANFEQIQIVDYNGDIYIPSSAKLSWGSSGVYGADTSFYRKSSGVVQVNKELWIGGAFNEDIKLGATGGTVFNVQNKNLDIQFKGQTENNLLFLDASTNRIGIGTATPAHPIQVGLANNAYLTAGGVWTDGSSVSFKENFKDVDPQQVLDKIAQLNVKRWNYIAQDESIQHIGPFAEDMYNLFNVGDDDKHLAPLDTAGIALVGIQGLKAQVDQIDLSGYVKQADLAESLNITQTVIKVMKEMVIKTKAIFEGQVIFLSEVFFKTEIRVNQDTAGIFEIPAGATEVEISFSQAFSNPPVVSITPLNNVSEYYVKQVNAESFIVVLNKPQPGLVRFNWVALVSEQQQPKRVKVLQQGESSESDNRVTATPTPTLSTTATQVDAGPVSTNNGSDIQAATHSAQLMPQVAGESTVSATQQ